MTRITVLGYQPRPGERALISVNLVGPDYLQTMGTPLVARRMFNDDDTRNPKVAIINAQAAEHYWPHANPSEGMF